MRLHSLTQSVSLYYPVLLHLCSKLHSSPAGAYISPETIISTAQKIALVIICIILKFDLLHGLRVSSEQGLWHLDAYVDIGKHIPVMQFI